MTLALAAAGSKSTALWYLSRGTGAAALVLLTATLVMGIADVTRWSSPRWPRFVVDALHGTLSLAAVLLVAGHVVTSVLDPFAPLRLTDAVIPFEGRYRPLWVGLGALAFDLLVVVLATSLLRRRIGIRAWRAVHWAAYGCWPLALAHTLGTGSDIRRGWMLALSLACTALVVIAIGVRVAAAAAPRARAGALVAMACGLAALALWLPRGPLGRDWARRAGTPAALLQPAAAAAQLPTARASPARLPIPFATRARGRLHSGIGHDGTALVDIALRLTAPAPALLDVRLAGPPLAGGGVQVARSQVTLGPRGDPARYIGRLETLDGARLVARLRPARGRPLRLRVDLDLGGGVSGGPVSAAVSASREPSG
jgi:sulfoxide reductase heme-binding subunit YedZ